MPRPPLAGHRRVQAQLVAGGTQSARSHVAARVDSDTDVELDVGEQAAFVDRDPALRAVVRSLPDRHHSNRAEARTWYRIPPIQWNPVPGPPPTVCARVAV